jgi:hypothetical protein
MRDPAGVGPAGQRVPGGAGRSTGIAPTSTRWASALVAAGRDVLDDVELRLDGALDRNAFLAVLVDPRRMAAARHALLDRLKLTEVDVTRLLVETLRAIGVPWQLVLDSDAHEPTHPDRRNLQNAVRYEVVPRITQAIDTAAGPVLVTEAAPLARYDCMDLLAELADTGVPRPAARLLLAPAQRAQPLLDNKPIPVISPSQWLWLPAAWLDAAARARPPKEEP